MLEGTTNESLITTSLSVLRSQVIFLERVVRGIDDLQGSVNVIAGLSRLSNASLTELARRVNEQAAKEAGKK